MATEGFKPRATKVNLPPAGHQRDEVLKKRQDQLEEKAETQTAQLQTGAIDPEVLKAERELLNSMDSTMVTGASPNYHYTWVNFQSYHGWAVKSKLAFRGWEVVTDSNSCKDYNPGGEAAECRQVDGTRKLGDVLLMRIAIDRFNILQALEAEDRNKFSQTPTSNLSALADKYRDRGLIVRVNDSRDLKTMESRHRGAMAAQEKYEAGLRDGTIQGV